MTSGPGAAGAAVSALALDPVERRFLLRTRSAHADRFEERWLELEWRGALRRSSGDGAATRELDAAGGERIEVRSPGARVLAPFDAAQLAAAEADLAAAAAGFGAAPPARIARCERRLRVATRAGAWERREVWFEADWPGGATRHWVDRRPQPPAPLPPLRPLAGERRAAVLFAPQAAGVLLHELLGHGLEAGAGGEPAALRPGLRIGPAALHVEDRPLVAAAVDDEGSPCAAVVLVADGVVVGELADRRSGRSNGRGRRSSFRDPPLPRQMHLAVAAGPALAGELEAAAQLRLPRAREGEALAGGEVARLVAPWLEDGRECLGPARVEVELADLVRARLGAGVEEQPFAWCVRDGQPVSLALAAPALLVPARVAPC